RWTALGAGMAALVVAGVLAWAWVPPAGALGFPPSLPASLTLPDVGQLWQQARARLAAPAATRGPSASVPLLAQGAPLRLDRPFDPTGRVAVLVEGSLPAGWTSMYWRSTVYEAYASATWQPAGGTGSLVEPRTPLQLASPGEATVELRYR